MTHLAAPYEGTLLGHTMPWRSHGELLLQATIR